MAALCLLPQFLFNIYFSDNGNYEERAYIWPKIGCLGYDLLLESDNKLQHSVYSLNTIIQDYNLQISIRNSMENSLQRLK